MQDAAVVSGLVLTDGGLLFEQRNASARKALREAVCRRETDDAAADDEYPSGVHDTNVAQARLGTPRTCLAPTGIRPGASAVSWKTAMTREQAWDLLCEFTKSDGLRKHALAVEACVAAYARKLGEDEAKWSLTALLHDFDWEIHPTLE